MEETTTFGEMNSWLDAHQALWRLDGFQSLGRLHACIDSADTKMNKEVLDEVPSGLEDFKRMELTSFGRQVGGDVPRWWVFAGEEEVRELLRDTQEVFLAAQTTAHAATDFGYQVASDYKSVIDRLCGFVQRYQDEIDALRRYAENLRAKHELAPAILFSYAVWGSTRRGERSLSGSYEDDGEALIRFSGELALGVRKAIAPVLRLQFHDLVYETLDTAAEDSPVAVSTDSLLWQAQIQIRENLIVYFTKFRDSLRHIDTLCQEFFQRENSYADDRFARQMLNKISKQGNAVETDLWDIKETLSMWSVPSAQKEAAAIKFAEQVAAFANKRGGVILIGVADDTHKIVGVQEPENRIKRIEGVVRKYTDSDVDFVRTRAVPFGDAGNPKSCLIVVVGKTDVAVGVRQVNGSYSYPLRVGPGLERSSREKICSAKTGEKGVSYAFTSELAEWFSDVA